jgi:putative heme-binding domain-containing protein
MKQICALFFALSTLLLFTGFFRSRAIGQDAPAKPSRHNLPRILYATPRVVAYQLRRLTNRQLIQLPRNTADPKYVPVYEALLSRPGLDTEYRLEAIKALAALNKSSRVVELIAGMERLDQDDGGVLHQLALQLTTSSPQELQLQRSVLKQIANGDQRAMVRRIACAALVVAEGALDSIWESASLQEDRLIDLLGALPMIPAGKLRDAFYPKIESLIIREPEGKLRNAAIHGISHLPDHGRQAFMLLAEQIQDNRGRTAAVISLRRIDDSAWPREQIEPLLKNVVAFAQEIPVKQRDSGIFLEVKALGLDLVEKLPREQGQGIGKVLRSLTVPGFLIKTVTHQMLYDQTRIVVEAGKQVSVVLVNDDLMPHNLVIVTPGAHEEIGIAAEALAALPTARDRGYVPDSNKVLWATKLLLPGQTEKLSFTAPNRPGVYPYVCTYPGHWRRMYGAMYVVNDLESYHADPKAYLAQYPLQSLDELLKEERPHTPWTYEQLAPSLEQLSAGRSFDSAKKVFQIANCVACHRLNGEGNQLGPDLTKLDPKLRPREILGEILNPSKKINENFFTHTFVLETGKTITGLIVAETAESFQVTVDPLTRSPPVELKKTEIESRQKSTLSMMPRGLLDHLTREEILDLIAYVASHGDRKDRLFRAGHDHGSK